MGRKKKIHAKTLEKYKRQERLLELVMSGFKRSEIIKQLKMGTSTFTRDMNEINSRMSLDVKKKSATQIYVELDTKKNMRTRRYWNIVLDEESSRKDKIFALNALRDEDKDFIKNAQALGILGNMPTGFEAGSVTNVQNNTVYNMLLQITKEEERLKKAQGTA